MWKQYNLLLCHIIENIDSSKTSNCWLYEGSSLSLEFLVKDYIDHMEKHIQHLNERFREITAIEKKGNQNDQKCGIK